jgi:hypothetical protein
LGALWVAPELRVAGKRFEFIDLPLFLSEVKDAPVSAPTGS